MHQISMQIQSLSNKNLAGIFPKRPKSASATDEKRVAEPDIWDVGYRVVHKYVTEGYNVELVAVIVNNAPMRVLTYSDSPTRSNIKILT